MRRFPSLNAILSCPDAEALILDFGREAAVEAFRAAAQAAREAVLAGQADLPSVEEIVAQAAAALRQGRQSSMRAVFNLTGVVLHTNLGRALIAEAAAEAAMAAMRAPMALEYDLETGGRGERDDHVRGLLRELTGAEDATVVNNNAAAVLLCLNTLAAGREAVISRGELIEIGGSFRMPDIMARAGAAMVEIGTTNRTHARDYRDAIGARTGAILKVHTSNYRVQGFTAEVGARELAGIADEAGVPLVNDLGSGSMIDLSRFGLHREPTVREAVCDGAGLVTFSGDKLLGGPQAGFIVGRSALIAAINRNPMKRALRVDKIRLAIIEATLRLYRNPDRLAQDLPTLRDLARPQEDIRAMAERLRPIAARALGSGFAVEVRACRSQVGSGAQPLETLASAGLAIRPVDGTGAAVERLAADLRRLERPVIGRIADGALLLDLRCLTDEAGFAQALAGLDRGAPSDG